LSGAIITHGREPPHGRWAALKQILRREHEVRGDGFIAGLNVGLTEARLRSLISVLGTRVGKKQADNAAEMLNRAVSGRIK
jgi:hypothetical protein